MSHEERECLRALVYFIKSNSGGWWFRVPMLLKTGEETVTVLSDEYVPDFESPPGRSTEILVEGLILLTFPTVTTTTIPTTVWRKESHLS
jgi:hypothetical protein